MSFNLSRRPDVVTGISTKMFCDLAKANSVEIATLRAVDDTESAGSGFLTGSQRPKILFEGHCFYRLLKKIGLHNKAASMDPTICYPEWTKRHYIGREGEYARLAKATEICKALGISDSYALKSASWGRYQIMGFNHADAGYDTVEAFVEDIFRAEDLHIKSFFEYINNSGLIDELQNMPKNPAKYAMLFAHGYNGAQYRRNRYDVKIVNARSYFLKKNINCASVNKNDPVVVSMPGIRDKDPLSEGFANTSLDNRHLKDGVDEEIAVVGLTPEAAPAVSVPAIGDPGQLSEKENIVIEKHERVKLWDYLKLKFYSLVGVNFGLATVSDKLTLFSDQYKALGISGSTQTWLIAIAGIASISCIFVWIYSWRKEEKAKEDKTNLLVKENSTSDNIIHFSASSDLEDWKKWGAIVVRR